MLGIQPTGEVLGATVKGADLSRPLPEEDFGTVLRALGRYGVLRFPAQALTPAAQKAFASRFGSLEINVAGMGQDAEHPEIMYLSNIVENGKPLGLSDAGQEWHTDMSYSATIALANVLHAVKVPRDETGRALGATRFAGMHAAYDGLPQDLKERLSDATAVHDFNKFWEMMRREKGSKRPPLTEEQRRKKPPVSHPVFLTHPITGRKVLYAALPGDGGSDFRASAGGRRYFIIVFGISRMICGNISRMARLKMSVATNQPQPRNMSPMAICGATPFST
jgi:alpha-ketoglutarate-dependent taurine dioxygenase